MKQVLVIIAADGAPSWGLCGREGSRKTNKTWTLQLLQLLFDEITLGNPRLEEAHL